MADSTTLCEEAVKFMDLVLEADSFNRDEALSDLKFRFGDQWMVQIQQSRMEPSSARPMLVINETDAYCRQVINHIRLQRPRGRAHPTNGTATIKTAKVMTGLGRHIETHSDASYAYDLGADFAVTCGFGYWRVCNDYLSDRSFDQDIYVRQIDNPFGVYYDPYSVLPDGSDSERVLLTDEMPKSEFRRLHPGANDGSGFKESGKGDSRVNWITKDAIRIAEYIRVEKTRMELVKLSSGRIYFSDELPPVQLRDLAGVTVVGSRQSWKKKVICTKLTAFDELEESVVPGRWIPVVPVYGINVMIDEKRRKFGMVRFARDPQRMINYWNTSITEILATAPKAKWLIPEGADEGHENEFANANVSLAASLHYKPYGPDGQPLPPGHRPDRIQPEMPPEGVIVAAMKASENLQRVVGMFDPINLKHSGPKSGEAIRGEKGQAELGNFHFYDNVTRSINHTWRIFLDWAPTIYDLPRTLRIIGDDNKPRIVAINTPNPDSQAAEKILNDVRVGDFDVVMETGPGFNTKREEAQEYFAELMGTPLGEVITKVGADIVVRMSDAEGAEQLADRLAASNPLAQVDENSEVPPRAQMMIKGLQDQLQKATQLLHQAGIEIKFGLEKQRQKDDAANERELIKAGVKVHDVETIAATKQHDTEMRAFTAQNIEEIKGLVSLLSDKLGLAKFEREIAQRDRELESKANESATASSIEGGQKAAA